MYFCVVIRVECLYTLYSHCQNFTLKHTVIYKAIKSQYGCCKTVEDFVMRNILNNFLFNTGFLQRWIQRDIRGSINRVVGKNLYLTQSISKPNTALVLRRRLNVSCLTSRSHSNLLYPLSIKVSQQIKKLSLSRRSSFRLVNFFYIKICFQSPS